MGKRPPDKIKLTEARLAGARTRLADLHSRDPDVDPQLIDETSARIAELEAVAVSFAS